MTDQVRADELAAKYIKLREFHDVISRESKDKLGKIKSAMDELESEMMTFLNQSGQESSNTKSGTFFKRTSTSATVADRDVFLQFVWDNDAKNFLENRVNKTAVDEYIAEHDLLPPGVDVVRKVAISVNRPKTR